MTNPKMSFTIFGKLCKRQFHTTNIKMVSIQLQKQNLLQTKLFINGSWKDGVTGKSFSVLDPATNEEITKVSKASEADYGEAIQSAFTSFQSFKKTSARERSKLLSDLYQSLIKNKEDLGKILCYENGKPLKESIGEIEYAASFFQWYSEEAPRIYGDVIPSSSASKRIITIRQPIGVVGIMTPWNFPAAMITRKLGCAIAAGCTAVIKPASETPLTALAIGKLCEEVGFPPGVVNILATDHEYTSKVGALLCEHPKIKKISFTGSTGVGKILQKQASSTLKKTSFELGGNAPFIVFDDADIDKAIEGLVACKFRQSGQTCVCANRIFVQENVFDEFLSRAIEKVKGFKLGKGYDTNDSSITHGPLINKKAFEKIKSLVDDAKSKGAEVEIGGEGSSLGHNFYKPTILTNLTPEMDIFTEEIFGPIAPIIKFETLEEVISLNNSLDVGLSGYFFTKDINRMFKLGEALEIGMIGINTGAISEAAVPFGGVKESGFGREGSKYGIEDYTTIKTMIIGVE